MILFNNPLHLSKIECTYTKLVIYTNYEYAVSLLRNAIIAGAYQL